MSLLRRTCPCQPYHHAERPNLACPRCKGRGEYRADGIDSAELTHAVLMVRFDELLDALDGVFDPWGGEQGEDFYQECLAMRASCT